MDIQFPSTEAFQYILSYDGTNASFTVLEVTGIDQIRLPESYRWRSTLAIAVFLGLSLVLWRLWTFTVRPWMNPDEPREVPYWVPCKKLTSCVISNAEDSARSRYSVLKPSRTGVMQVGSITSWNRSLNGILSKQSWSDYQRKVSIVGRSHACLC